MHRFSTNRSNVTMDWESWLCAPSVEQYVRVGGSLRGRIIAQYATCVKMGSITIVLG